MAKANVCCRQLQDIAERYAGTLELSHHIVDVSTGKRRPPVCILRLYPLTAKGYVSIANASWIELYYCPFCGVKLIQEEAE